MNIKRIPTSYLSIPKANPIFKSQKKPQNDIKVSVIVPVYNQEKFITKALDSLQNQTLKDVEFICINDGSQDNSLAIIEQYAQRDKRFKIINQKNQGSGIARNNGLKIAKGEYIAFLDPDDWLETNALEELYKKSKKQDCDMLVFNFVKKKENGEIISRFNLQKRLQRFFSINENENFNWQDIKPRVLGGMYPVAWNKFYKHDFVKKHKLHFAKSNLAEDNVFVFGATLNAEKIGYLNKTLYTYLIHNKSAIRTLSDKNFCIFSSIDSVKNLIKKLGLTEELKNEFDGYILRFVSFHLRQIISKEKFKEVCRKKLSPSQNKMLNERYAANSKVLPLIEGILAKKLKL